MSRDTTLSTALYHVGVWCLGLGLASVAGLPWWAGSTFWLFFLAGNYGPRFGR